MKKEISSAAAAVIVVVVLVIVAGIGWKLLFAPPSIADPKNVPPPPVMDPRSAPLSLGGQGAPGQQGK